MFGLKLVFGGVVLECLGLLVGLEVLTEDMARVGMYNLSVTGGYAGL